ncbi:MAG: glycine cleavage system aminomethyltransferase GcvT, partial [Deltaproteobacteria bacterium]|nr:glycine cleavage system aminomethyltransferase GcvT [Deltaproteobacteria bacterium]
LKKTPLYEIHKSLGARIVDFAGWEMPVQYSGVIDEHVAVRSSCGLFDVSHMGEVEVSGPGALAAVKKLATNNIERVADGQCQYTIFCYDDGGTVDDTIVYRFNRDRFLFCVNASNTDKAFEWISSRVSGPDVLVENLSNEYAQLALQGPASTDVVRRLLDIAPSEIKPFHFVMAEIAGMEALVSRTGYTGEDGFEIYLAPNDAARAWEAIMEAGRDFGIKPVGLGARDTLRLEMGYPLYGHELGEKISPIEAGLKKYVRFDGRGFIGEDALRAQHEGGVKRTLVGFTMKDPGVPRAGYVITAGGTETGVVTSGTSSPSLKTGIGMGFVKPSLKEPGTEIEIMIRTRAARAEVARPPFYAKKILETAV